MVRIEIEPSIFQDYSFSVVQNAEIRVCQNIQKK